MDKQEKTRMHHDHQSGQVLIVALITMLMIVIGILFLFDMQTIIRGKLKLETAEQSAALTAAEWQRNSLNLIGSLNLVKACDLLLYDVPPYVTEDMLSDSSRTEELNEAIQSSSKTVSEMQSRVAFIGPMIAFGAANQAAKNNGMAINGSISNDVAAHMQSVASDMYSSEYIPEYIYGYRWRGAYLGMLQKIYEQGIAVRPGGRFTGLESVNPSFLADSSFYEAIEYQLWCHPYLNQVVKYSDSYWQNRWWQVTYHHTVFPQESEFYTLGTVFSAEGSGSNYYNSAEDHLNTLLEENGLTLMDEDLLPNVGWCIYDSYWYNQADTAYWRGGIYLRSDLENAQSYSGALAYAQCGQELSTVSAYSASIPQQNKINENLVEVREQQIQVGGDSDNPDSRTGSLARPLGSLEGRQQVSAAAMVLPVFERTVLLPSTLFYSRPLRSTQSSLESFLEWLATVDDLNNPETSPPEGTERYLAALQQLNTESFRRSGWNNNYSGVANVSEYFSDDYKYSESNANGAGWLQQAFLYNNFNYDPDEGQIHESPLGEYNTAIYYGGYYILRSGSGTIATNEQIRCYWTPGGSGGRPPGTNFGPPRL